MLRCFTLFYCTLCVNSFVLQGDGAAIFLYFSHPFVLQEAIKMQTQRHPCLFQMMMDQGDETPADLSSATSPA